ncbi:MAG TPA: alkaline phosphatase family protein [Thermoanaerobaculia bacterium]|jgi:arylsulfatase A-like enzyme|nr:alkaline phosphatase family protein [Thermoanaerobaculia bacterium]
MFPVLGSPFSAPRRKTDTSQTTDNRQWTTAAYALLAAFFITPTHAAQEKPRLVVVISVDQLRFDYVDRFSPWLTERGFKRFTRDGAVFSNARYRYSGTFTGPGHASIGTGLLPAESGIVGNSWFERDLPVDEAQWNWYFNDITAYASPDLAKSKSLGGDAWWKLGGTPRYCTYDERVKVTAGRSSGMSPANLAGDSLADRVKEHSPQSRVIALAIKDRASILMGGRRADAAYWFDRDIPGFISSSYYRSNPDVFAFNQYVSGYMPASLEWRQSSHIPPADLQRVTFDPPEAWPLKNTTYGGTFPHPVKHIKAMTYTPFAQDLIFDFAQHIIVTESLGSRDAADLLFVGVTATDYVGHYYGPDSLEVADNFARLDRSLAHFLDALERRFGDRVLVAITADHGVQPNPEIVKLRDPKADAGRVDLRTPDPNAKLISDLPPTRILIERNLARTLGLRFDVNAPISHAFVYFFEEPSLWLNWKRITQLGLDRERVKRALRDVLGKMDGVAEAFTSTELLAPDVNASRLNHLMRASYRADRSGDVLIALRPGWIWMWGSNSTTHGQPVENDMHVPLMFWGSNVKRGVYDVDASPLDLARTLATLLGTDAGGRASNALPCF